MGQGGGTNFPSGSAGVKYWVRGWLELEKSCFHPGQAARIPGPCFSLEKRVFLFVGRDEILDGGFGERRQDGVAR